MPFDPEIMERLQKGVATDEDYAAVYAFSDEVARDQEALAKGRPAALRKARDEEADEDAEEQDDENRDEDADAEGDDVAEAEAGDEDADDSDDEDDVDEEEEEAEPPVARRRVVRKAAGAARKPAPAAAPSPRKLRKAVDQELAQVAAGAETFDASAVFSQIAASFDELVTFAKSVEANNATEIAALRKEVSGVRRQLRASAPADKGAELKKAFDAQLADRLEALQQEQADIRAAVSSRPSSPHPRAIRKGGPAAPLVTKDLALDVLEKALGSKSIGETEYANACVLMDHAAKHNVPYEQVLQNHAPGALGMLKSMLGGA